MTNINKATKFILYTYTSQTIICFAIVLLNILISMIARHAFKSINTVGSTDVIGFVWIFILGLSNFKYAFKFMLSCGVSRKAFYISLMISMIITSIVWSALNVIFSEIGSSYTNVTVVYKSLYNDINILGSLIWNMGLLIFMLAIGTLITLIYYRFNKKLRLIISIIPFVLYGVIALMNIGLDGAVYRELIEFLSKIMGFAREIPSPYIGALTTFVGAVIISPFIFLLLSRAPIKD